MTVYSKDRTSLLLFFIFFGSFFLLPSCKKTAETIGADFLGPRSGIGVESTDTSTLILYSSTHDSVPTKDLNYFMLGALNDPDLGITRANVYTQISLPIDQFTFGAPTVEIDSIVLQLKFATSSSVYGDPSSIQNIKVYKLSEQLSTSDLYYSNRSYQFDPVAIGEYNGPLRMNDLTDSVYITVDNVRVGYPPHIRIPLDKNNFPAFFRGLEASGGFQNSTNFRNLLNGIAIDMSSANPSAGQGALAYMNLKSTVSSIVVFYHEPSNPQKMQEFLLSGNVVTTNKFMHDPPPASVILQPYKNGSHQNICYVQPAAGIKTRVLLPNLLNYVKEKRIAIIGAEVVFTLQPGYHETTLTPPYKLLLVGADSLGRNDFLEDAFEDTAYYGGRYTTTLTGDVEYRFNVIRQLQLIMNTYKNTGKDINYGMNVIVATDFPVAANRIVLNTNRSAKKVKLNLTYTVIK